MSDNDNVLGNWKLDDNLNMFFSWKVNGTVCMWHTTLFCLMIHSSWKCINIMICFSLIKQNDTKHSDKFWVMGDNF